MIDLYTWTTPNGRKPAIMLEETGLEYKAIPIDIGKGEQFAEDFLKISPNNKIPAIVDHDAQGGPVRIFESGAILFYLAEKTGSFLPAAGAARAQVLQWLNWQMGGVGPMFGQFYHFRNSAPSRIDYALNRYRDESFRLLTVMDKQLAENEFLAGDYSIADMATYPWVAGALPALRAETSDGGPEIENVERWLEQLAARSAVQRGMNILK
ncbi:MAG: glutathione S-transferase N-terminal domain-containing protein [Parvularculaceae bacterium]